MDGIITLDIGTTSMRSILYDSSGHALHMEQRENIPRFFNDGRVEQDAQVWQTVLPEVLRASADAAAAAGIRPLCISVTSQRSSVIPVDGHGTPLFPAIMWQDRRTADIAREMDDLNDTVYRKSGLKISPVFSALKMTWLRRNRSDIWNNTRKLIGIQDWVLFLMTGRYATDHTFGSRTNLMDLAKRRWDPDLLSLFGVDEHLLCDLVEPGSVIGGLTAEMASAAGLTGGLPVVSAGGDQQCAALGLGLFSGDRAVSNTGTGSYLIGHADRPVFDEKMRVSCNVSAVPGAYIVEAAILTTGTVYRWFNEALGDSGQPGGNPFAVIDAEARLVPPGSNGVLLLPHFKGCGSPYWDPDAKGVFFNLTLSTTRGEMSRAILEGIAMEMEENLELVETLCGRIHTVSVSGGMTKSDLFNQIQCDIFGRRVLRFKSSEATSRGAWIAGAVASGLEKDYPAAFNRIVDPATAITYQPVADNRETYYLQHCRSRALYHALAAPELRELFK